MPKARKMWTNFAKGELSPRIEGRPDLALYFNGAQIVENFLIFRQGGLFRRPGTRFAAETKDSTKDSILIPFEFSVDDTFMLEFGDLYIRFYKDGIPILTSAGGPAVEVVSPYLEAQLRDIHFTQSADVLFIFHPSHGQRTLSRVSDTNWVLSAITYIPPPSFEADADISAGNTLTPGATTGTSVIFTAAGAVFVKADVGRQIIFGASRAVIVAFGASAGDTDDPNDQVRADILDAFPDTDPIASGSWLLRLSPQTTLDPNIKEPIGAQITLTAGLTAFRSADVGKFIKILGGVIEITQFTSATALKGEILSILGEATAADPPAVPAGAWTLEENSWSATRGFPRTGDFAQGRLGQASTAAQPTTNWFSASDDFDNYAVGTLASNAIQHTLATRKVNQIEWMIENIDVFLGTAGNEIRLRGAGTDEPLGGDTIPIAQPQTNEGSSHIQAHLLQRRIIFVDRSRTQIHALSFQIDQDGFDTDELTAAAEHITAPTIRLGPVGFQKRPNPILYFVRSDGTLIAFTFFPRQEVVGFTRIVTDGTFEAVGVIPQSGKGDQVWVIVKRTITGTTRRYVEFFDDSPSEFVARAWQSLQTDSAFIYDSVSTTVITGLGHLDGEVVDVVADGAFRGTKVVSAGQITLTEAASKVEIGLHYDSKVITMRPAIEGAVIEGLPRSWDKIFVRLNGTIGGKVNGEFLRYTPDQLDSLGVFKGDREVTGQGWDTEGRITVEQTEPYPMELLAAFGTLSLGEHG